MGWLYKEGFTQEEKSGVKFFFIFFYFTFQLPS